MNALPYRDLEEELPTLGERVLLFDSGDKREHVVAWREDFGAQAWVWRVDAEEWDFTSHRYWLEITPPGAAIEQSNTDHRASGEGGASEQDANLERSPGASGAPPINLQTGT